jgi:hypothetical protein
MKSKIIQFMGFTLEAHYHNEIERGLVIDNLIHTTTQEDFMELIYDDNENELNRILSEALN